MQKNAPTKATPIPATDPYELSPYATRKFSPVDNWALEGLVIKPYIIDSGREFDTGALSSAARKFSTSLLSDVHDVGAAAGFGYAIMHYGLDGVWLLLNWWAFSEINCQIVAHSPSGASGQFVFTRLEDTRIQGCVWERIVSEHERRAWIEHMLRPKPDPAAYLADKLPKGAY